MPNELHEGSWWDGGTVVDPATNTCKYDRDGFLFFTDGNDGERVSFHSTNILAVIRRANLDPLVDELAETKAQLAAAEKRIAELECKLSDAQRDHYTGMQTRRLDDRDS